MIKLLDILREEKEEQYVPYMYSPVGFSCHVCRFHFEENGLHKCSNSDYKAYQWTDELIDEEGNPIKDPTKWCSNWFLPADADTDK